VLLGGALLCVSATAQERVPFPLDPVIADCDAQEVILMPNAEALRVLSGFERVTLVGAPLPDGTAVDLDLERIDVERRRFGLHIDGRPAPELMEAVELSLWQGEVLGRAGTDVHLSFSNAGCSGWIHLGGTLVHLLPRRGDDGTFGGGDVLMTTERAMARKGEQFEFECAASRPEGIPATPFDPPLAPQSECSPRECTIAIEGDYQLSLVFADEPAMVTYVVTLLSYVSNRYEEQAHTVLTFPYLNLWTTPDDPWDAQDAGGNCIDVLYELQSEWGGQIPEDAVIGHLLSGANLGCGVAWVDVLCETSHYYTFSVSGNINGGVAFPVVQQPSNWDFMVIAHELGHNFASYHTHDYCPPLDECPPEAYWGPCQDEQLCTSSGTIMSYCHLCDGGTANITTWFHPFISSVITLSAAACLPAYVGIDGHPPDSLSPGQMTQITATARGTGTLDLHYRFGPGMYHVLPMTDPEGDGVYSAWMPAASCGDEPQFYFYFTDEDCGPILDPPTAPNDVYTVDVGVPAIELWDDFGEDLGWTSEVSGATSGAWERAEPVADSNWPYAPGTDVDGNGICWVTGNQSGSSSVHNGTVTLTSPVLDLTGGGPLIRYSLWLDMQYTSGEDYFEVSATDDGTSWEVLESHQTTVTGGWVTKRLTADDLDAAGLVPSDTFQMRFTAHAKASPYIFEAAIDGFLASVVTCELIGDSYCGPADLNSTGKSALLHAVGSTAVEDNRVALAAQQLPPGQFGMFLNSLDAGFVPWPPGSQGILCVGGAIGRYVDDIQSTGPAGWMSLTLDLTDTPTPAGPVAIQPGETWHFQGWFRDWNPGPTSNFTDGVMILFE